MNKEYMKKCRLAKGYSQPELARELGVYDSTVYMWETKGKYPKAATIIRLCKLLDMDANILLGIKGE